MQHYEPEQPTRMRMKMGSCSWLACVIIASPLSSIQLCYAHYYCYSCYHCLEYDCVIVCCCYVAGNQVLSQLACHQVVSSRCKCASCGAPALVAFSGKRQWFELINTGRRGKEKITKFDVGPQILRPEASILVFVLSHGLCVVQAVQTLHTVVAIVNGDWCGFRVTHLAFSG